MSGNDFYVKIASLLRAQSLPATARTNGNTDWISIALLIDTDEDGVEPRLLWSKAGGKWGYTLLGEDGIPRPSMVDDLDVDATAEEVAQYIIDNVDFIFDSRVPRG